VSERLIGCTRHYVFSSGPLCVLAVSVGLLYRRQRLAVVGHSFPLIVSWLILLWCVCVSVSLGCCSVGEWTDSVGRAA